MDPDPDLSRPAGFPIVSFSSGFIRRPFRRLDWPIIKLETRGARFRSPDPEECLGKKKTTKLPKFRRVKVQRAEHAVRGASGSSNNFISDLSPPQAGSV